MVDHCALGWILAGLFGLVSVHYLIRKRDGRGSAEGGSDCVESISTTNEECRSGRDDVDVIIVGAGVAGAALVHTLGKPVASTINTLAGDLYKGASGIILPIIRAEGGRQMFFPVTVPAYYRAPPQAVKSQ